MGKPSPIRFHKRLSKSILSCCSPKDPSWDVSLSHYVSWRFVLLLLAIVELLP